MDSRKSVRLWRLRNHNLRRYEAMFCLSACAYFSDKQLFLVKSWLMRPAIYFAHTSCTISGQSTNHEKIVPFMLFLMWFNLEEIVAMARAVCCRYHEWLLLLRIYVG